MRTSGARVFIGAAVVFCLAVGTAATDVKIEEKVTFDGFGGTGWGASMGTTRTSLSGDSLYQETTSEMTGKVLRHFTKQSITGALTRLDRGMLYTIDHGEKSYMEIPLGKIGEMSAQALDSMSQAPPPEPGGEAEEPPEVTCDPVVVKANETGKTEQIGGFSTKEFEVTGSQTCTNNETGDKCTVDYRISMWGTPVTGGLTEMRDFAVRQAKAMGFDPAQMKSKGWAANPLLAGQASGIEAAWKELSKIEGYPMRTRFTIETDEACGAGGTGESGSADSGASGEEQGAMEGMKKMFSKFKKKDKEGEAKKEGAAPPAPPPAKGKTRLFGMTSEVQSISTASIPASTFEIPAGFRKEEWNPPQQ